MTILLLLKRDYYDEEQGCAWFASRKEEIESIAVQTKKLENKITHRLIGSETALELARLQDIVVFSPWDVPSLVKITGTVFFRP